MERPFWGWLVPVFVIDAGVSAAQTTVTRRSAYTIVDLAPTRPFPDDAFADGYGTVNGAAHGFLVKPNLPAAHAR